VTDAARQCLLSLNNFCGALNHLSMSRDSLPSSFFYESTMRNASGNNSPYLPVWLNY
jgi:hypothetical protein